MLIRELIFLLAAEGRISGLNNGGCIAKGITDATLDLLGGEQMLLRIPRLRIEDWQCDPALLLRWLNTSNDGNVDEERVLVCTHVTAQLVELIQQEFTQATEQHKFIVIHRNGKIPPVELLNARTQERLVCASNSIKFDGYWSCIRREPLDKGLMNDTSLEKKYGDELFGLSAHGRTQISL